MVADLLSMLRVFLHSSTVFITSSISTCTQARLCSINLELLNHACFNRYGTPLLALQLIIDARTMHKAIFFIK